MSGSKHKKSITLQKTILQVFVALIVITVSLVCYLVFSNWLFSLRKATKNMAKDTNSKVLRQIEAFISDVIHASEVNRNLIVNQIADLDQEIERDKYFVSVLKSHDTEIYSFSVGTENGEYYGARRNEKGEVEIMKNNAETGGRSWYYSVREDFTAGELTLDAGEFDPRTREWYKTAKEAGKPIFSPVYRHFVMPDMAISAALPVYDEKGDLWGILGTHMILSNINRLLAEIVGELGGYTVIAERDTGELIANSFGHPNFFILPDGTMQRIRFDQMEFTGLVQAYQRYRDTGEISFVQKITKDKLYMDFHEITQNGLEWVIMTAIPESLLNRDMVHSIYYTAATVFTLLIVSIALCFIFTRKLTKPVGVLIATASKIAAGDLTQRVPIFRDDELGRISVSFNHMADTVSNLVNNLEATVAERTAALEKANNALTESREQLRVILDSAAEGIYGIDMKGRITFCNASCMNILGYTSQEELLGEKIHGKIHHSLRDGTPVTENECKILKGLKHGEKAHVVDEVFWRADGTCFDVEYYSYPQYKDGTLVGAVVTFLDITERRRDEEKILYLSKHDSLTGLMNRHSLEEKLKEVDTEDNLPISVIFVDINGLKLTNDIFGHAAGDNLILKSAEIIRKACRQGDIIARVGGDEFIILLLRTGAREAKKIMGRIKAGLYGEKVDAIKCSMALGTDTKTHSIQSITETISNAEDAMYREKTLNRKANNSETLNAIISTLHEIDPEEMRHSIQVSEVCESIAKELKLPKTEVNKVKRAGYLHDIGKVVLKKDLVDNSRPLTDVEVYEVQQHTAIGYRILNLFDDTMDIADAVYSHHERWDGLGYPQGLKAEEIPLYSRIISLAEAYDRRMHGFENNPWKKETVVRYIRENAGKRFDPELAEVFIQFLQKK